MRRPVVRLLVGLLGLAVVVYGWPIVRQIAAVVVEGWGFIALGPSFAALVVGLALAAFAAWPRRSKPRPPGET